MKADILCSKGKGKIHPRTDHEGPEGEYRYNSTLSLTSALDGVAGQRHAPAALPPGMTRMLFGYKGLRNTSNNNVTSFRKG